MRNSQALTDSEQTHVAQWMIDHPKATPEECAITMQCTPAQVRYAVKKARQGKLSVRRNGLSQEQRAQVTMAKASMEELINKHIHLALAQLDEAEGITVAERVQLLGTLARTHRTALDVRLSRHMNVVDEEVIYGIIRRFKPGASDAECIQIYLEEVDRWKATQD